MATKRIVKIGDKKKTVSKRASVSKEERAPLKKSVRRKTEEGTKKKRTEPNGPEALRDVALKILDARKAENVVALDVRSRTPLVDYMLVATGGSSRQLGALAGYLREAFFKAGQKRVRIEGVEKGDWVLVDAGDVLVHLFRPEVRAYYDVEELWQSKAKT